MIIKGMVRIFAHNLRYRYMCISPFFYTVFSFTYKMSLTNATSIYIYIKCSE